MFRSRGQTVETCGKDGGQLVSFPQLTTLAISAWGQTTQVVRSLCQTFGQAFPHAYREFFSVNLFFYPSSTALIKTITN